MSKAVQPLREVFPEKIEPSVAELVESEIATSVIGTMHDGIVVIEEDGTILHANPALELLFGYPQNELIGQNVSMLVPSPHAKMHDEYLAEFRQTGKSAIIGNGREVEGVRSDGTVFPLELSVTQSLVGGRRVFVGVARDVTERREAEQLLNLNVQVNRAINKALDQFISSSLWSKKELFDDALDSLLRLTQSKYGFIGEIMHTPDGSPYLKTQALTNIAWDGEIRRLYKENARKGLEFFNLDTLFGATIRSGEVVIADEPMEDPRSGGLPMGHPSLDAYMGVPIYAGNKFIGMAGLANRDDGYDEDLVDLIKPFLGSLGSIIAGFQNLEIRRKAEQDLYRAQQKLRTMATQDLVTNVANRASVLESTHDAFERCRELVMPFSVLFLDIDRFKAINDEHGHQIGDQVLKAVAERVREIARPTDILGRYGGEEFLIGLVECSENNARAMAERIVEAIRRKPVRIPGKRLNVDVTVSIGVATSHRVPETVGNLIDCADRAMYAAKNGGRDCVRVNKLIEEV